MNTETIYMLILEIGLILILVKLLGELFERIEMPSIFGEILLGVLIGPVLGVVVLSSADETMSIQSVIKILAEIGAIFLLFSIGFEKVDMGKITSNLKRALPITLLGAAFPFAGGFIVGYIFSPELFPENAIKGSLVIGTAMAATSIGVSARALMDMKYIATAAGSAVMATSVADSFLSLAFFAAIYGIISHGAVSYSEMAATILKLAAFCLIIYLCGKFIFPRLARVLDKMIVEEAVFATIVGVLFTFAYLSSIFGLSTIIGAFIFGASIAMVPRIKSDAVVHRVRGISYGFFVPFFFLYIGLMFDFGSLASVGLFAAALIFALLAFQITGGFIGGKISRFGNRESLIIAAACIPRNELALIIAAMGLTLGIYDEAVFSAFVLLSIVTTIITPLLLRVLIKRQ